MKKRLIHLGVVLCCVILAMCVLLNHAHFNKNLSHFIGDARQSIKIATNSRNIQSKPSDAGINETIPYQTVEKQIETKRKQLAVQYKKAKTSAKRQQIINQARIEFVKANSQLAPYWYGTPWSFHGTSQTPQQGHIACGYFVTTLLEDAGLKVQRAKLAQQASENIIKTLTTEKYIKRFHNVPLEKFVTAVKKWGKGLYVVGLDYHAGLLWHDGEKVHFIHSAYVYPKSAFSEPAKSSPVLASSKYRVIGKISADDSLIKKWLKGQAFITKT